MMQFDPARIRPHSTVLIIAPRCSGASALLAELLAARSGPCVLVDGSVQTLEQCVALLEADLRGKTVVLDNLPLGQLPAQRCGALRAALHKELELDLLATVRSVGELSALELRNADYLCLRNLARRDYRRLAKLCGHSMKKLARAEPCDGWLIIDRRGNRLYQLEVAPVLTPTCPPSPELEAAVAAVALDAADATSAPPADAVEEIKPAEAAEATPQTSADAPAEGLWSYITSWF